MPDNVQAPATGLTFATDELTGQVHWPYAKMAWGADGAAVPVADANGARFPVAIGGTLPAFAAPPTVNIGTTPGLTDAQLRATAVPVSAAALPLPAGASTEATLAVLAAKIAALEGGRTPVAVQAVATATRAYTYASGQRLTTSGAGQVRSTAVAATEVLLHASVRGFLRVGSASVTAEVNAGSIPLEAGEKFHLQITSGQFISWIRDGATDGSLSIVPVA